MCVDVATVQDTARTRETRHESVDAHACAVVESQARWCTAPISACAHTTVECVRFSSIRHGGAVVVCFSSGRKPARAQEVSALRANTRCAILFFLSSLSPFLDCHRDVVRRRRPRGQPRPLHTIDECGHCLSVKDVTRDTMCRCVLFVPCRRVSCVVCD